MEVLKDSAVGVIPVYRASDREPLFCLIKDKKGYWGFPKGHQDGEEAPLKTARREMTEESGIDEAEIDASHAFFESYRYEREGRTYDKTVTYFLARVARTDNKTPEAFADEISDMRWMPYDEALSTIREQSTHLVQEANAYLGSKR